MDETLLEAVQQPNVSGALQQLLLAQPTGSPQASAQLQQAMQQRLLSRESTPEQSQQLQQNRASALQQYQASLMQPQFGTMTPTEIGAYEWVGNMGKLTPFAALTSGIAAGGKALADSFAGEKAGNVAAAKAGYDDAVKLDDLDSRDLTSLRAGAVRSGLIGGGGSFEKVLPLYGKLFNSFSQQAKDMQFATPEEKSNWIREHTDAAMRSTLSEFGGAISPAVLDKLHGSVAQAGGAGLPSTDSQTPAGAQTQAGQGGSLPQTSGIASVTPTEQKTRDANATRIREGEVNGTLPAWPTMPPEPSKDGTMTTEERATFSQRQPPGEIPFRNIPNEKLTQSTATAMGAKYAGEYDEMTKASREAKVQYDALRSLENIDPSTGMFADIEGGLGTALQSFGIDPKSPSVVNAIKNKEANALIAQMGNAALRQQVGVQTRSDEVRIGKELAQTTDPAQAFKFLVKLGIERTNRQMEAGEFASANAASNNGVPLAPSQRWVNLTRDDPLTQTYSDRSGKQRVIFRTDYINRFMETNPGATREDAISDWKQLEKEYNARTRK